MGGFDDRVGIKELDLALLGLPATPDPSVALHFAFVEWFTRPSMLMLDSLRASAHRCRDFYINSALLTLYVLF